MDNVVESGDTLQASRARPNIVGLGHLECRRTHTFRVSAGGVVTISSRATFFRVAQG